MNWNGLRRRGKWLALVATAGIGSAVLALTLSPSTFEIDGDMVHTGSNLDWDNAPNLQTPGNDDPNKSTDNSFGQGAKEDVSDPTVVTDSIPPNKSNLTHFYVASDTPNNQFFLYLAWTRSNVLGNANMDFEFNQSSTIDGNGVTPVRTAGDVLITFDFVNGGGNPVLGLLRWVTTGSKSQCFSANALPCWGNHVNLSVAGFAIGAVNTTSFTDPISGDSLVGLEFGEAAINLTGAIGTSASQCFPFASAFVKSRSSASFTAEMKDFIAPITLSISNCGDINIRKSDDLGNPLGGAIFTLFGADGGASLPDGGTLTCTSSASGTCSFSNVLDGDYLVSETGVPNGYVGAADQPVTVPSADGGAVTLDFVNTREFRIVTYVCRQGANTLYPSDVKFDDGGTLTSLSSADAVDAGLDETTLCTMNQGAHFDDRHPGDHPGNVNIPDAGP
jgi:hypothetical protein